jgi:hypothetical protein
LTYEATIRAVLLDPEDSTAVLALQTEEIPVAESVEIVRQRQQQRALQTTTGPRPSTWTGETGRNADEPSFTYAFQFGKRDVWKIGHTKDVVGRLADVNKHVPWEVLGEQWQPVLQHPWPTEGDAYEMEQRVLIALRKPTCVGERVACAKRRLESVWIASLTPPQRV